MKKLLLSVLFCLALCGANAQGPRTFAFKVIAAVGLMPENTVPAFLKAMEIGVNTVELNVVVSQEHQLVVSH